MPALTGNLRPSGRGGCQTSGHTTPTAFVQSIGRLRSNVPRFLFATASGTCIGNGSTWANEVQATKAEHAVALYRAGAALADPTLDSAAFFSWWAKLAAEHTATTIPDSDSCRHRSGGTADLGSSGQGLGIERVGPQIVCQAVPSLPPNGGLRPVWLAQHSTAGSIKAVSGWAAVQGKDDQAFGTVTGQPHRSWPRRPPYG